MGKVISTLICFNSRLFRDCLSLTLRMAGYSIEQSAERIEDLSDPRMNGGWGRFVIVGSRSVDAGHADLQEMFPSCHVVVLLEADDDEARWTLEGRNVAAVLRDSISSETLLAALELIGLGERVFSLSTVSRSIDPARGDPASSGRRDERPAGSPEQARAVNTPSLHRHPLPSADHLPRAAPSQMLSEHEREVLACLGSGTTNKMIARHLGLTEATVKVRLKSILRKIGAGNRTQAAVWAFNNGAITDDPERKDGTTRPNGSAPYSEKIAS